MKRRFVIGLLALLVLAACHRDDNSLVEPQHATAPQTASPVLAAIDSLAWQQPDSALVQLLAYLDDTCRDAMLASPTDNEDTALETHSMRLYDRHYAHVLLAELFYKNDYAQTNREELLQAVDYYDSVTAVTGWAVTRDVSLNDIFLAARAHYINGVGYYETDSILDACKEYMKAVETMEEWFDEKDLTENKAKFMALAYTHLTKLFSDQYLHEQSIYFGKEALEYYNKYDATAWHKAWILNNLGSHYNILENYDSAYFYYCRGLAVLENTNNLIYRDIATRMAYLSYQTNGEAKKTLNQMRNLLAQSESERELLARYSIIGEIFYHEQQLDSAYYYLKEVFDHTESLGLKKQAAEWLVDICKAQGRDSETREYAEFLVPFANMNENQSLLKSQLTELYHIFGQDRLEIEHRQQMRKFRKFAGAALVVLAAIALVFIVFHFINKKRHKHLKRQNEEKERQFESIRFEYEIQRKALLGKLKQRNEELRAHKEERENMRKSLEMHQRRADWSSLGDFLDEDICKEIMNALHNKDIKREAKVGDHIEMKLSATQLSRLDVAVEKHFQGFTKMLTDLYPRISNDEMHQCLLYLLDVEDVHIAHLLFCDYSTVKKRSRKLKTALNTEKELRQFIREIVL